MDRVAACEAAVLPACTNVCCGPAKGCVAFQKVFQLPSLEQAEVRGVSAGGITSQAELMAPDREERG